MYCVGPPSALCSLILFFAFISRVCGAFVNHTIDDTRGDSLTKQQVLYLPTVPPSSGPLWQNQTTCADCADVPDPSLSFDNTWTAALYEADAGSISLSMTFSGSAIYVFFIVPNFIAGSGLASEVRCNFFIDGVGVGSFTHESDGSGAFDYDTLVYKNVTVPDGDHVFLAETTGANPAVIIFDFAIYTTGTPDSDPGTGPGPGQTPSTPAAPGLSPPASTATSTVFVAGDDTSASTSALPTSSSLALLAFPTAPDPSAVAQLTATGHPMFVTGSSPDGAPLPSPSSADSPSVVTNSSASQRMNPTIAIVSGIAGALVLLVFIFVLYMVWRRRRARNRARSSWGTVSVFDLLDHNPPPPSPRERFMTDARPLPIPPGSMSEHGRSIGATPSKPSTSVSGSVGHRPPPISSHGHSVQSSVSGYSDARSDLHIHIPMTAFSPATPITASTHSPVTRNGAPLPPEQDAAVRALLFNTPVNGGSLSMRRGSTGSGSRVYTPTTETGREDDDDLWGQPMMHVDSGIRISRALMELPPDYSPA